MKFVPSAPNRRHQIRVFQQSQMFRHRLPRHVHARAKFAQRLTVVRLQPVQQFSPRCIRQRLEHFVHKKLYATFWLHVKQKFPQHSYVSAFTPFAPLRYNGLLVIAQESAQEF